MIWLGLALWGCPKAPPDAAAGAGAPALEAWVAFGERVDATTVWVSPLAEGVPPLAWRVAVVPVVGGGGEEPVPVELAAVGLAAEVVGWTTRINAHPSLFNRCEVGRDFVSDQPLLELRLAEPPGWEGEHVVVAWPADLDLEVAVPTGPLGATEAVIDRTMTESLTVAGRPVEVRYEAVVDTPVDPECVASYAVNAVVDDGRRVVDVAIEPVCFRRELFGGMNGAYEGPWPPVELTPYLREVTLEPMGDRLLWPATQSLFVRSAVEPLVFLARDRSSRRWVAVRYSPSWEGQNVELWTEAGGRLVRSNGAYHYNCAY